MIRLRRCTPKPPFRRRRYEVEFSHPVSGSLTWRRETSTPVTFIESRLGVAEAWALIHAADEAWGRHSQEWISLPESAG
jgi:hypothetical protein